MIFSILVSHVDISCLPGASTLQEEKKGDMKIPFKNSGLQPHLFRGTLPAK